METMEFLKYLNLALREVGIGESKQDEIWFKTKALLDELTISEVEDKLSKK